MNRVQNFRNRVAISLVIFAMVVVTSGCAEGVFHVTLHPDGSADLHYKIGVHRSTMGLLALTGEHVLFDWRRNAEKEGYLVSSYSTDQMTGLIASKRVDSIESAGLDLLMFYFENPLAMALNPLGAIAEEPIVTIKERLFYTEYTAKGNLNLSGMDFNLPILAAPFLATPFGEAAVEQINLEFIVTLPIKAGSHNADDVRDGGYTLAWTVVPGENREIEVQGKVPNIKNSIIFFILLVASCIVATTSYLFFKQSKRIR